MTIFTLDHLNQRAKEKPFGYKNAVLKLAKKTEQKDTYSLDDESFKILSSKYKDRYNIIWKIKSLFKHIYSNMVIFLKTRKYKASKKVQKQRYDICLGCEHFNKKFKTCNSCGCFLPGKTALFYSECPLKKWK